MKIFETIGLYLASVLYVCAGIMHFIYQKFYLKAMPPYIPFHKPMVLLSGAAEIILGLGLLFPVARVYAAWGLSLLLVAVFPANIYMATSGRFHRLPSVLLWLRLPLQLALIWWVYQYT